MRYSHLRAFHHVALHGGFSRAAAMLGQTQPALSDQVRRLEQDHDVLLFHRDGRRIRPTAAGEALFVLTRRFFEAEDAIAEQLERARAAPKGTLRIVADSALHVTRALGAFRARHPGVFVRLGSGNSEEVLAELRGYDAEIGIVGSLVPTAEFDAIDLGLAPIVAIAARGLLPPGTVSLGLAELQDLPLVFREKGSRTRRSLEEEARRRGVRLVPAIEVEGREAMREIVASGAGVGFVSEAEIGHDPRIERIPLSGLALGMTETLVCLAMRRDLPVIRAFMAEVRRLAAAAGQGAIAADGIIPPVRPVA